MGRGIDSRKEAPRVLETKERVFCLASMAQFLSTDL